VKKVGEKVQKKLYFGFSLAEGDFSFVAFQFCPRARRYLTVSNSMDSDGMNLSGSVA
jgi:hypothetical protein